MKILSKEELHEIDKRVGARIRYLRSLAGLSQEKLADMIGLTFQQLQKYEGGVNRISAGRLLQISMCLKCNVQDLFNDEIPNCRIGRAEMRFLSAYASLSYKNRDLLDGVIGNSLPLSPVGAIEAFSRTEDAEIRRKVSWLIEAFKTGYSIEKEENHE